MSLSVIFYFFCHPRLFNLSLLPLSLFLSSLVTLFPLGLEGGEARGDRGCCAVNGLYGRLNPVNVEQAMAGQHRNSAA